MQKGLTLVELVIAILIFSGTYVMCINPKNPNQIGAIYSEPKLITSPFPLK